MSEEDWLKCDQVPAMLAFLGERASQRKLWLFCCATCRMHEHLTAHESIHHAIEFAECRADEPISPSQVYLAWNEHRADMRKRIDGAMYHVLRDTLLAKATIADASRLAAHVWMSCTMRGETATRLLVGYVRDVFGNPFRPVTVEAGWRTADVVALAQAAYDERQLPTGRLDAVRVSILADALEDVGCAKELVGHLRGEGPHVRGCWVVDLLLDKS